MNFTWGAGAIVGTATDFAGVRWSGRIRQVTTLSSTEPNKREAWLSIGLGEPPLTTVDFSASTLMPWYVKFGIEISALLFPSSHSPLKDTNAQHASFVKNYK